MKLKNLEEVKKLFEIIDRLENDVFAIDGASKLSLKSKLCRLIVLSKYEKGEIDYLYIECENKNDEDVIKKEIYD